MDEQTRARVNALRQRIYGQPESERLCVADAELPEFQQAAVIVADGSIIRSAQYGVTYQRCGGGRRVIRKRLGSN